MWRYEIERLSSILTLSTMQCQRSRPTYYVTQILKSWLRKTGAVEDYSMAD